MNLPITDLQLYVLTNKQIKVDIRSDRGVVGAVLLVEDWDLITPYELTVEQYIDSTNNITGFNSISKLYTYNNLHIAEDNNIAVVHQVILDRISRGLWMHKVQGNVGMMFAGKILKDGRNEVKVYITVLADK
jgi:hypothetical protein